MRGSLIGDVTQLRSHSIPFVARLNGISVEGIVRELTLSIHEPDGGVYIAAYVVVCSNHYVNPSDLLWTTATRTQQKRLKLADLRARTNTYERS